MRFGRRGWGKVSLDCLFPQSHKLESLLQVKIRCIALIRRRRGKIWEVNTESVITAGVGSDGQYVAVGTAAGEVEVYGNDGKRLWRVKLSSEMSTPPLVGAGFVIVRTADTRVTAFDALTGERRWRYQSQIPSLTLRAPSQMKFSPAGVLVGQANGRLLALDGQGRTVFDAVIAQPKGITEVERLVDVVGTPLVDANMMCAAAFQGGVVCMSAQNGRLLWQADVDAVTGPVTDGARVYVVTARGQSMPTTIYPAKRSGAMPTYCGAVRVLPL